MNLQAVGPTWQLCFWPDMERKIRCGHREREGVVNMNAALDRVFISQLCRKPSQKFPTKKRQSSKVVSTNETSSASDVASRRAHRILGNLEARRFRMVQPSERVRREPQIRQEQERSQKDADIQRAKMKMELTVLAEALQVRDEELEDKLDREEGRSPPDICSSIAVNGSPGLKSMDPTDSPGLVTTRPSGPSGQKPRGIETENHGVVVGDVNNTGNQLSETSTPGRSEPARKQLKHPELERGGKEKSFGETTSISPTKLAYNGACDCRRPYCTSSHRSGMEPCSEVSRTRDFLNRQRGLWRDRTLPAAVRVRDSICWQQCEQVGPQVYKEDQCPSGQKPQNDDTEDHEVTVGGTSANFHKNQAARISPLGRPDLASKQRMYQDRERSGKETGSREASSTSPSKLACNAGKEAGDRTRTPSHGSGT
ncbi:hypothetical protein pipiens_010237 [Culex pipiens pipiens]|uniref:Uncharacterized protein n=1 Tax=Culex pipiens pipiens TaxID=38569 RepID=A0ABD1DAY4_CULPP